MFALYSRSLQAFRVPYHSSDLTSPHLSSSKRSDILLAGLLICEFGRVRACILLLYFASLNSFFLSCFVLWIAFSLLSLLKLVSTTLSSSKRSDYSLGLCSPYVP